MLTCDRCKRSYEGDKVMVERSVPVRWNAGDGGGRCTGRRRDLCNDCAVQLVKLIGSTVSDFFGEKE